MTLDETPLQERVSFHKASAMASEGTILAVPAVDEMNVSALRGKVGGTG